MKSTRPTTPQLRLVRDVPEQPSVIGSIGVSGRCAVTQRVLDEMESASRRMEDLAKELHCLGYFDDDDDRPRAA
ncbi:MAG TPA: hypothetical protein PK098_13430 [Phycisphaerales bacterium]|nr:hypothetical protein [Phycisphaerales bacterium]